MAQPEDFVSKVLAVVESIPPGRVMTYGDVAAAIGSRGARAVGQVMARYGAEVPWWRVIRSTGHAAAGHEASALRRFEREGTPLIRTGAAGEVSGSYRVRLVTARHRP